MTDTTYNPYGDAQGNGQGANGQSQPGTQLTPQQAMALAVEHQAAGRLQQSEQILRQILKVQPRHAPAIHLLGVIAHQCNKTELAVKLIANAIALAPGEALFHSNIGEMYRILGKLDQAIEHGKQAVTLNPSSATAHTIKKISNKLRLAKNVHWSSTQNARQHLTIWVVFSENTKINKVQ
jgi:tetratricopeptide (TPR) repeat protein